MKFTPVPKENTVSVYTQLGGVKSFLDGVNSPRGWFHPGPEDRSEIFFETIFLQI